MPTPASAPTSTPTTSTYVNANINISININSNEFLKPNILIQCKKHPFSNKKPQPGSPFLFLTIHLVGSQISVNVPVSYQVVPSQTRVSISVSYCYCDQTASPAWVNPPAAYVSRCPINRFVNKKSSMGQHSCFLVDVLYVFIQYTTAFTGSKQAIGIKHRMTV